MGILINSVITLDTSLISECNFDGCVNGIYQQPGSNSLFMRISNCCIADNLNWGIYFTEGTLVVDNTVFNRNFGGTGTNSTGAQCGIYFGSTNGCFSNNIVWYSGACISLLEVLMWEDIQFNM